jgi:hypothetical protein
MSSSGGSSALQTCSTRQGEGSLEPGDTRLHTKTNMQKHRSTPVCSYHKQVSHKQQATIPATPPAQVPSNCEGCIPAQGQHTQALAAELCLGLLPEGGVQGDSVDSTADAGCACRGNLAAAQVHEAVGGALDVHHTLAVWLCVDGGHELQRQE